MALDDVTRRMKRITVALDEASIPYAIVGGQAIALWVATRDPAAVRTTTNVNILLRREDLSRARAAARAADMDYCEVMDVGMLLERDDPNPRHAVHIVWAAEKVKASYPLPSPTIDERLPLDPDMQVVSLAGLVRMKLMSNRDQDRVHVRDMIEVELVGREMLDDLPDVLARRLEALLDQIGR